MARSGDRRLTTKQYLEALDVHAIERRGCDFTNPRFFNGRIGKPIDQIDRVYDYDFQQLREVEHRLSDVDRPTALRQIFADVVGAAETATEKHLALLRFLQKASYHGDLQPVYPDRSIVTDPLVLLQLNEMRCGHVARVAVDLFQAGGIRARCVSLGRHVIAEAFYDDHWHYFDANLFGNGHSLFTPDGAVPSVRQISRHPERLDALPSYFELTYRGNPRTGGTLCPSDFYFARVPDDARSYFQKHPTDQKTGNGDRYFGWHHLRHTDPDWTSNNREQRYQPGAVAFERVTFSSDPDHASPTVEVAWKPLEDKNADLLGYRVFVSSESRGWNYAEFAGSDQAKTFWSSRDGWKPEMYERLFSLPPHDVALIETAETHLRLPLTPGRRYFLTVMPFDAYHEALGRKLYFLSNEISAHLPP